MAEEVNSLSGASNVVLEVEPSQFSSPNFQKREEIMQRQNSIFREQLGKFHQLLEIQKRLTGRDPLNPDLNEPVQTPSQDQKLQTPTPAPKTLSEPSIEEEIVNMVNSSGGIYTTDHVEKLLRLMSINSLSSNSQSLILTVIKSTNIPQLLKRLVDDGVLNYISSWLSQSSMKIPHLRLILKTLLFLPISVKSLQESSVGRHVNKLKSHSDSEVSKLATQCVKEWSNLLSNVVERKVQSEDLKQKKKRPLEEPEVQNTNKNPPLKRAKNIASSVTQTTIKATPTSPSLSQSLNQTTKPNILSNAPNSASTNPTTKPPAPKKVITSNDDFDSELSKKPVSKAVKINKTQIIEEPGVKKPIVKSSTYVSKPLSADDIKKAKKAQSINQKTNTLRKSNEASSTTAIINPSEVSNSVETDGENNISETSAFQVPITDSTQTLPITEPVISLSKSGAPKKKVKWESDDKLVTIKEYIKDEGEKMGTNFEIARKNELLKERAVRSTKRLFEQEEALRQNEAFDVTIQVWENPKALDLDPNLEINHGSESKQAVIQNERENKELAAWYMHDSQIPESPFEPPLESDYDESTVPIIPFEDISNVPPAQPSAELLSSYGLPPNIDLATFLSSPGVVEDLLRLLAQGGVSNTLPLPILQALLAQTNVLMQTQNKPTFPTQPSLINIPSQSNYLSPTNNFISQPISNSSVPYFSQSVPFVPSINPSTNPLANRVPNNLPSPNLNFPNNLPYGLNFLPRTQPPQIQDLRNIRNPNPISFNSNIPSNNVYPQSSLKPPCPFFLSGKGCRNGIFCPNSHEKK